MNTNEEEFFVRNFLMNGKINMAINILYAPSREHLLEEIKYITFRLGENNLIFVGKSI